MLAVELRNYAPKPSGAELGDRIAALCAQITLSEHALLTTLREFEASSEWVQQGALSCAQWLSWRVGMGPEASREHIRVAKALGTLGKIDEAFGAARVSYSKVRAMTRVATAENEELLLEIARGSTAAQLERICRKFRGHLQDEQPAAAELKRRVSVRYGDDGTMRFSMVLAADEGSRLLAAIESGRAALDADAPPDVSAESSSAHVGAQGVGDDGVAPARKQLDVSASSPASDTAAGDMTVAPRGASRADGLMALVESWFATGPQPRRGGAPHEVVLHVSAQGLSLSDVSAETSDQQATPSFIESAGGGAVSTQTARRLCCDASVHAVLEDGQGQVLNVGRKRRTVPPAITRALEAQNGRVCSFPGCTHTLFLDRHHIQHWADGGSTSLDNLCQLCRHHHTFVHEYGWRIEKVGPKVYFYRPDGLAVEDAPDIAPLSTGTFEALADPRPVEMDELSLATAGWGEPVDMVQVVDALIHQTLQERAARASDPERVYGSDGLG